MTPEEWNTLLMDCQDEERPANVKAARDRLFFLYCNKINRYLSKLSKDEDKASDLTQETFKYVLLRLKKAEVYGSQSNFETFLFTAAKNVWRHHRRGKAIDKVTGFFRDRFGSKATDDGKLPPNSAGVGAIPDPEPSHEEKLMMQEDGNRANRALAAVQEPYRTPLIMRDQEGYSYEEIAIILNRPIGTVKSQISRGREQLSEEYHRLRKQEEGEDRKQQGGRR